MASRAALRLSAAFIMEQAQKAPVRKALRAKADQGARQYDSEATAAGLEASATVSEGVRPKGRPYARVSALFSDGWGDGAYPKRRIMANVQARLNSAR